jgi:hypothetical protein
MVDAGVSILSKAYFSGASNVNGGWETQGSNIENLIPWQGLAIKVSANTRLRFKSIPSPNASVMPSGRAFSLLRQMVEEETAQPGEWSMRIDARRVDNDMGDMNLRVGMKKEAIEEYDKYDWYHPPYFGEKNIALLIGDERDAFMRDYRPLNDTGAVWPLTLVTGDHGTRVQLNLDDSQLDQTQGMVRFLVDDDNRMAYDLKRQKNIEVGSRDGIHRFRLIIGTKEFALNNANGIDLIPTSIKLFTNYPNPFNPETVIRYTLTDDVLPYRVSLKLYNVLGQLVASPLETDQPGGYYEFTFNGRNLSSGIYFARLSVSAGTGKNIFNQTIKMVLAK